MRSTIKVFIVVLSAVLVLSGIFLATTVSQDYFISTPSSSTVFVENGVSGVVTLTDPYLKKTTDITIDYRPITTGSGVIVTSDGYILTAFHVIANPQILKNQKKLKMMEDNDIKQYLEQIAVTDYIKKEGPQLINELTHNDAALSSDNDYIDLTELYKKKLISVKSYKQVIRVKIPSTNMMSNAKTFDAQLIDVGNSKRHEDVALLKIENVEDLPYLPISSKKPVIGEKVVIYGYPGYEDTQYQDSIRPTASGGTLLSKMFNSQGVVYYKTNAETANGISGGPVLNDQNKVMGILIYGIQKQNYFKRSLTSDSGIFLSSDYLIKICKKNNVPLTADYTNSQMEDVKYSQAVDFKL